MSLVSIIGLIAIYLGTGLCLISALGLIRLPDVYARFHAATKALTGGVLFLTIGGALYNPDLRFALRLMVVALLFLFSNPIGTHAIARAVHRTEVHELDEEG